MSSLVPTGGGGPLVSSSLDPARAVAEELNLPTSGRTLHLGHMKPVQSVAGLERLVSEWRQRVKFQLNGAHNRAELYAQLPMLFGRFCEVTKASLLTENAQEALAPEEHHFRYRLRDPDRHPPTFRGYVTYLRDLLPATLGPQLGAELPVPLAASERLRHTYIVASTGSGKSELLKALIYEELKAPQAPALVVVDAHSDLCEQVARWPELAAGDRLVFVAPRLLGEWVPCINPLELPPDADERSKEKVANRLSQVLAEVCRGSGAEPTVRMLTLLKVCILVLLDRPGSTLADLSAFMAAGAPPELVAAGLEHRERVVREFFAEDWTTKSYDTTKQGVRARLQNLLLIHDFRAMTCGPSTVPLYELVNRNAVVLLSLGAAGKDAAGVIGKLVVALLGVVGDLRKEEARENRHPVHIFLDECQNFTGPATETILAELRKYGMHLTLAHQFPDQLASVDRQSVLAGTAVKMMGRTTYSNDLLNALGCDGIDGAELLRGVDLGLFVVKWGNRAKPFLLNVRSDLADSSHTIRPSQWIALQAAQRRFYRRAGSEPVPAPETAPAGAGEAHEYDF